MGRGLSRLQWEILAELECNRETRIASGYKARKPYLVPAHHRELSLAVALRTDGVAYTNNRRHLTAVHRVDFSKSLARLEARGLVARDGAAVSLTAAGRRVLANMPKEKRHELLRPYKEDTPKKPLLLDLDMQSFPRALREHPRLAVHVCTEGCGACKEHAPVVESLAREFAGTVTFARVNHDESPSIMEEFGDHVEYFPALLFFSRGKHVGAMGGPFPADAIRRYMLEDAFEELPSSRG